MISIEVRGLEDVERKLSVPLPLVLLPAWLAVGEEVRNAIATYPGPVALPFRWASPAQRRAVMAKRRELGPYVRGSDAMSQRLGPSWTVQPLGMGAVVGTPATYGPYVQSAENQQPGHQATGWKTDEQAVREVEASGVIEEIVERTLRAALGG